MALTAGGALVGEVNALTVAVGAHPLADSGPPPRTLRTPRATVPDGPTARRPRSVQLCPMPSTRLPHR